MEEQCKQELLEEQLIPLDKSWMIRLGVLDILTTPEGKIPYIAEFFSQRDDPRNKRTASLQDDLVALWRASHAWQKQRVIDVGESGTLYRFLQFVNWSERLGKEFLKFGTLSSRTVTDTPEIIHASIEDLLKLDHGTSQWASARAIWQYARQGTYERIDNPPVKLQVTYDAITHWDTCRRNGVHWESRYDDTILQQAMAFIRIYEGKQADFQPTHAEDYCFARAFGMMTKDKGEQRWPNLHGHETDRLEEMEKELQYYYDGEDFSKSMDHRVVQAISMLRMKEKHFAEADFPHVVNKSWPQFWTFLHYVTSHDDRR